MNGFATATSAFVIAAMPGPVAMASATAGVKMVDNIAYVQFSPKPEAIKSSGIGWADSQIRKLSALQKDWDGYGADPILRARLSQLAGILENLFPTGLPLGAIVPGADGSLQAEWHYRKVSFGLLVDSDGSLYSWQRSRPLNVLVDAEGPDALALFQFSAFEAIA